MKRLVSFFMTLLVLCSLLASPSFADASSDTSSDSSSQAASDDTSGSSSDGDSSTPEGLTPVYPQEGSVSNYQPDFADDLKTQGIYMLNLDSDEVVYEKEAQKRMYPASLTKIMTCIVALENVDNPDTETTDLKAYIQNHLYNLQVDTLGGIYLGESLTIRDLLYAMMLQSANEAAMMIADYVGDGNIDYFCEMMNKKAKEIGANNTYFGNATGLDDTESYTTAYDMALIAKYAMQNPDFVELVTTLAYTSQPTDKHENGITWYSINSMQRGTDVDYYYEGTKGVKTGTLPEQNIRNYVSTCTRDGYTYLLVMLGAPIRDESGQQYKYNLTWKESAMLYDWAFETFQVKTLMTIGEEVSEVGVRLSWDVDHIKLLAADKFASLVPNETTVDDVTPIVEIENYVEVPIKGQKDKTEKYINAPIKKGQTIGYVKLMLGGEEVGRVPLVAAQSVEQSKSLYYLDKIKSFFNTFIFKFVFTFVIIILVLYIVLMIIRNRNRRRYKMRKKRPPQRRR